jgi:hypothetical protein
VPISQGGALAATVSGVVGIVQSGALAAQVSGTVTVTATLAAPATVAVSGTVTISQSNLPAGTQPVSQGGPWATLVSGVIGVTQSGAFTTLVSGTITTNQGSVVTASIPGTVTVTASTTNPVSISGTIQVSGAVGGAYSLTGTVAPIYAVETAGVNSSGNLIPLRVDDLGRLVTAPAGSTTPTQGFAFGLANTSVGAEAVVRATTYTEQATNAQRSVKSSSTADAAAGTGARTIQIIYYDQNGVGPLTETITLNGTTAVNTVGTNICFIEDIIVLTAGTGLANAGTITLFSTTGGTGTAVASVGIGNINSLGDNQTLYAAHYVPSGTTCYITGISVDHNGTTAGSGGAFYLRVKYLSVVNGVEVLVSDVVRLYGQSSTVTRNYGTPLVVKGPARITMYVFPETATSTRYRGSFDFYQQ